MAEAKKTEEMVRFHAFKDDGRYKDDIFVAVNGKTYQIKRGEDVMIPKCVYEVLMNSQVQDQAAYRLMEQKADEFKSDSKKFGE
jgi:hypothetical protein